MRKRAQVQHVENSGHTFAKMHTEAQPRPPPPAGPFFACKKCGFSEWGGYLHRLVYKLWWQPRRGKAKRGTSGKL